MTFRIIVKQNPVQVEFEAGSVAEAIAILQDEKTHIGQLLAEFGAPIGDTPAEKTTRKARSKNQPDPASAAAPPPAPIPQTPAPAPTPPPAPASNDLTIPAFLDRTAPPNAPAPPNAAPAAPPPPPAPAPAPIPAAAASPLAGKVVDDLKKRAAASGDKGAALATWLGQSGAVLPGATFDESIAVLQFLTNDKLAPIAAALGVS